MLKRNSGKEICPDTFIYSVPVFRLVKHNDFIDEEYIYIRVAVENRVAYFLTIEKDGQYGTHQFRTDQTFLTTWSNTYTVYECEVDNIDVEYH